MHKIIFFGITLTLTVFTFSCKENIITDYKYSVPEVTDDGWEVESAENLGVNSGIISEMMDYLRDTPGHNLHSILIFREGKLIFEAYFDGYLYSSDPPGSNGEYITYDRQTDHYLASVSKSVTSVIFGAAMKEGYIENLNASISEYFPEYDTILTGEKSGITLKHLLTMSSGLSWDETSYSYGDSRNDVTQLFISDDPIAHILSRPLLSDPGTQFLYNSGATNVLGAVIEKSTGMSLLETGNEYLFDPLNIEGGLWQRLPAGYYFASGGLFLRPRELAKIGYLFLNGGYWGEMQIITEDWINASLTEHIMTMGRTLPPAHAYGFQWWMMNFQVEDHEYYSVLAAGWGDQYMFLFKEQDMIVVFNGGNYLSAGTASPFFLLENYILKAI